MNIDVRDLHIILSEAVELGVIKALTETGQLKPFLNKKQAYDKYGRTNVDRWIAEGLVKRYRDGGSSASFRYDRVQLETVARSCNWSTYLTTDERNNPQ